MGHLGYHRLGHAVFPKLGQLQQHARWSARASW
jgi:hypothetical protein